MGDAVSKKFNSYVGYSAKAPWKLAVQPFCIAPHMYYVGNEWVGAYLVDTEEGLILLDTCVFENVYLTLESIRLLGFNPYDIKHIMLSHCHCDHVGGAEAIKQLTKAKIWISRTDAEFRTHPANLELDNMFYCPPYEVDEYYDFNEPMRFGNIEIQTYQTPGHTPGTTSFLFKLPTDDGKILTAAMHGGVGPMTMTDEYIQKYQLPGDLRKVFIEDCEAMKNWKVDIAISSHPAHGNLFERRGKDPSDYRCFIDEEQWGQFLESRIKFVEKL